jgi:hypothetical protein
MDLKDILKKSESKLIDKKYLLRKAIITRNDRPYIDVSSNANGRQLEYIKGTVSRQLNDSIKSILKEKNKNPNGRQIEDIKDTISIQKVDKLNIRKTEKNIWNIHGNEKKLYFWIESQCQLNELLTPPISKDEIVKGTGIAVTCLKKTIDRLIEKRMINIYDSKSGRFGWRIFSLLQNVKDRIGLHKGK